MQNIATAQNVMFLFRQIRLLTTSVRQAGVAAHRAVMLQYEQAARPAFVTLSFKIFLKQTCPLCEATCYTLPSRPMTRLFNGVNFVYRSLEVYWIFRSYLRHLVRIRNFYNGGRY